MNLPFAWYIGGKHELSTCAHKQRHFLFALRIATELQFAVIVAAAAAAAVAIKLYWMARVWLEFSGNIIQRTRIE